jgi:hypothetical protein
MGPVDAATKAEIQRRVAAAPAEARAAALAESERKAAEYAHIVATARENDDALARRYAREKAERDRIEARKTEPTTATTPTMAPSFSMDESYRGPGLGLSLPPPVSNYGTRVGDVIRIRTDGITDNYTVTGIANGILTVRTGSAAGGSTTLNFRLAKPGEVSPYQRVIAEPGTLSVYGKPLPNGITETLVLLPSSSGGRRNRKTRRARKNRQTRRRR